MIKNAELEAELSASLSALPADAENYLQDLETMQTLAPMPSYQQVYFLALGLSDGLPSIFEHSPLSFQK